MRRAPSRFTLTLAVACLLAWATPPAVGAEAETALLGRIGSEPLWVIPLASADAPRAVAVLSVDGTLWYVSEGRPPSRVLGGLASEQIERCGEALLAVTRLGHLVRLPLTPDGVGAPLRGPEASLLHRPLCLPDDDATLAAGLAGGAAIVTHGGDLVLVDSALATTARAAGARVMPDAEPVAVDLGEGRRAIAVLAEPTLRYRHGLLGDEVEALSVLLFDLTTLDALGHWRVTGDDVIEERRVTPWRWGERVGLHVTVSNAREGARVVTLVWQAGRLEPLAAGPALGRGGRWLHALGATGERLYALHTPHVGGELVRYELLPPDAGEGYAHRIVASAARDLTSHVLGERNLDRALLIDGDGEGRDRLALSRRDLRAVVFLTCDEHGCDVDHETPLPARLATNLALAADGEALVAADVDGGVWSLRVPPPAKR
jgi:hypothetical protein